MRLWLIVGLLAALLFDATARGAERVTSLVYEIDDAAEARRTTEIRDDDAEALVAAIQRRLGSIGHAILLDNGEIQINLKGDLSDAQLEAVKLRFGTGRLEFRILASEEFPTDEAIIKAARSIPQNEKQVTADGKTIARWARYSQEQFDPERERLIGRTADGISEALVLIDPVHLTGEYLRDARIVLGVENRPAIEFIMDERGTALLRKLTGGNQPNEAEATRRLAILLDDRVLAAPRLRAVLSDRALLSGVSKQHVDSVLAVLNEGVLPYAIREVAKSANDGH